MLVKIFEIICAIFTVYGIYTFIHDIVDLWVENVRKREIKRLKKELGKESNQNDDREGRDG